MKTNRKFALIAGLSIIIMAAIAIFSYGYAHSKIYSPQDTTQTIENLNTYHSLFNMELKGWMLILLLDIIAAWALYRYFKHISKALSLGVAITRIIYAFIFSIAILQLIRIYGISNDSINEQDTKSILLLFKSFGTIWSWALILFGIHLYLLGKLIFRAKNIGNFWSIILYFAAVSYILIHSGKIFLPEMKSTIRTVENILSLPMAFAEVGLGFWLVFREMKIGQIITHNKQTQEYLS